MKELFEVFEKCATGEVSSIEPAERPEEASQQIRSKVRRRHATQSGTRRGQSVEQCEGFSLSRELVGPWSHQ